MDRLKGFPFIIIFVVYLAYLGLEYYQFEYAPDGQVAMHQAQLQLSRNEIEVLRKKLGEGQKFLKTLDLKKEELRADAKKLSEYQGILSEALDVPALIKVLLTEAKKIQLKVDRIEPGRRISKEYYIEQEFRLDLKGSYAQQVLFAQRISQLQRILRIQAFSFKPTPASLARSSNQLDGQLSVRAYQYSTSKEDNIAGGIQ